MGIWTNQRVVVTGGAGFVGSHLAGLLLTQGADVVVVDDLRRGREFVIRSEVHMVDASRAENLMRAFRGAFAVFNLAAHVAGVIYNQQHQLEMYNDNERLQVAPVIAAQCSSVQRFLQVSSVCVYAPEHNSPALEKHGHDGEPTGANSGYSWAKRIGERAVQWSSIPHVVIVRPSNLYGPRDYFDERAHVIPALIKKALHDDVIRVNGTGRERREFLYVEDAAAGMVAALERGQPGAVYNLGTNGRTCVSIADLVAMIQAAAGVDKPVVFASDHDAGDPARWSNTDALMRDTGWMHHTHLLEGLTKTIAWYRERHKIN